MDPFILREQFKVPRGGNLSSASLSSSILPGQAMSDAGKQVGDAMKQMLAISDRRQANKMSLLGMENSRKMGEELVRAYKDLEVRAQKNPLTGEYDPLLLKDGTEGTYEKVWAEISGDIRDSYLTGDEGQDNPFLEQSASMFQRFALQGLDASIEYDRARMLDTFQSAVNLTTNRIAIEQTDRLKDTSDNLVDLEIMARNHYVDIYSLIEDANLLKIPSNDKDNLFKYIAGQITEAYIYTLLRRDMWESALQFMENGLKTKFGLGKDDSMFYLDTKKANAIREKIHTIQRKLPGGLNSQITHWNNKAVHLYETGDFVAGAKAFARFEELNTLAKRDPFFHNRALAERDAALDYFKLQEDLGTTPFADHQKLIGDFHDKHRSGLASIYTYRLYGKLHEARELLLKAFKKDGSAYVEKYDEATRESMKTALNETDPLKRTELFEKAIKIRLEAQTRYLPGNKPDILTIAQIEKFNDIFNQRFSDSKKIGLDGFQAEVIDFFKKYGEYGGAVLNELKNPEEGREEAASVTKLKSEIGVASIYGNTRTFNMIIGSSLDYTELKQMQWEPASVDEAKVKLMKGVIKFYKSMGYAKFRDFGESTMFRIAEAYNLGLTRQAGETDPVNFVEQTLKDLIENKWHFHENTKGGFFGFNEDVKYLSIPKNDNEGKAYHYESASKAIAHVRENPSILGIGKLLGGDTPSEGITMFKDAGAAINSGDGSGFMLGYVDETLNGKIILISDKVYSWDTWNADNYPEAFNYPEETPLTEQVGAALEPLVTSDRTLDTSGRALIIPKGESGTSFTPQQTIELAEKGKVEVVSGHRELPRQYTKVDAAVRKAKDSLTDGIQKNIDVFLNLTRLGKMTMFELMQRFDKARKMVGADEWWLWTEVFEPFINYDPVERLKKKRLKEKKSKEK